jgi:hypothetical protein
MTDFDPLCVRSLDIDVVCQDRNQLSSIVSHPSTPNANRPPTISHAEGRYHLEVGVTSVEKLLVDLVGSLGVHDARREDLWVGEVLEHPFARGLGVRGVDDHLEAAGGEDGGGVGTDVAGATGSAGAGGRQVDVRGRG